MVTTIFCLRRMQHIIRRARKEAQAGVLTAFAAGTEYQRVYHYADLSGTDGAIKTAHAFLTEMAMYATRREHGI